ncbi:MAG TPA: hypothetical protein VF519_14410 [Mycobacteriales bacterium]
MLRLAAHVVHGVHDVTGTSYGGAGTTGVYDRDRDEVRITVRLADLPPHLRGSFRRWTVTYESARAPVVAPATAPALDRC